jgi:hypothetical protein
MTLPLTNNSPTVFPSAHPIYAPVTIVTGHFCHSLSQSKGMGTAPTHAPRHVPTAAPKTSSRGIISAAIRRHLSVSMPCVYIKGSDMSRDMCAAQRIVWSMWVVNGAPKRMRKVPRRGVPRRSESVKDRIAGCSYQSIR